MGGVAGISALAVTRHPFAVARHLRDAGKARPTALTEAAYISAELKDVERTRRLANRARLLAHSPVLTDAQRSELRARLGNDTAFQSLLAFADKR